MIHTEAGEEDLDCFSIFLFLNDTTASFQHSKDIAWQAEGTPLTHTHMARLGCLPCDQSIARSSLKTEELQIVSPFLSLTADYPDLTMATLPPPHTQEVAYTKLKLTFLWRMLLSGFTSVSVKPKTS